MAEEGLHTNETPVFFYTSTLKLCIMSITTFGLYETFWTYKNWDYISTLKQKRMRILWRTVFGYYFVYPLFKSIRELGVQRGSKRGLEAGRLAIAWILLSLCWKLPEPLLLISSLSFLPLIPVQMYINSLNTRGREKINSKFSAGNWIAIILGGILWILVGYRAFMHD